MAESNLDTEVMTGIDRQTNGKNKSETIRTQEYWENRPEVYLMRYNDFASEYEEIMKIAQKKENKGNLDPHHPNYIPMTDEEKELHARDWKAFSKQRGFSDYDITEYARWHKISGQTDNLEYAINDPWRRRLLTNWEKQLYVKHIKKALNSKIEVPQEIMEDFQIVLNELDSVSSGLSIKSVDEKQIPEDQKNNIPSATNVNWDDDDSWN